MPIAPTIKRRLEMQGFVGLEEAVLAEAEPWLRLAPGLCAVLVGLGTATASPWLLATLVPIAALGAIFPRHPFDLLYQYGFRYLTKTGPLPAYRAPRRFACGVAAAWLTATAWAFYSGALVVGYLLGGALTLLIVIVTVSHYCLASAIYCALFGPSKKAA